MPTALDFADATKDFFKGEDPGPEYRTKYDANNVVGNQRSGSQNIPLVQARNALVYHQYRGNTSAVIDILDAWEEYAKLPFMTSETFSCNIYMAWILESIQVAHAAARKHAHQAHSGLNRHLLTAMSLLSFASGWKRNMEGFDGYPCVMTGARSWNGPHRYMVSASSFGSGWLAAQLLLSKPGWFYNGLKSVFGYVMPIDTVTPYYGVVRNTFTESDIQYLQTNLDLGPRSSVSATVVRTDQSVFWGNHNSINTGSTCFLPGKGWTIGENPCEGHMWSPDKSSMWLSVDRPARKWGGTVNGKLTLGDKGLLYEATRVASHKDREYPPNTYWDELKQQDVSGWRSISVPGVPKWVLSITPSGYKIYQPGDTVVVPPLPDSGGWHTIETDKAFLKFTNAEAAEALRIINDGGNHLPIHKVALLPNELHQVKLLLEDILK